MQTIQSPLGIKNPLLGLSPLSLPGLLFRKGFSTFQPLGMIKPLATIPGRGLSQPALSQSSMFLSVLTHRALMEWDKVPPVALEPLEQTGEEKDIDNNIHEPITTLQHPWSDGDEIDLVEHSSAKLTTQPKAPKKTKSNQKAPKKTKSNQYKNQTQSKPKSKKAIPSAIAEKADPFPTETSTSKCINDTAQTIVPQPISDTPIQEFKANTTGNLIEHYLIESSSLMTDKLYSPQDWGAGEQVRQPYTTLDIQQSSSSPQDSDSRQFAAIPAKLEPLSEADQPTLLKSIIETGEVASAPLAPVINPEVLTDNQAPSPSQATNLENTVSESSDLFVRSDSTPDMTQTSPIGSLPVVTTPILPGEASEPNPSNRLVNHELPTAEPMSLQSGSNAKPEGLDQTTVTDRLFVTQSQRLDGIKVTQIYKSSSTNLQADTDNFISQSATKPSISAEPTFLSGSTPLLKRLTDSEEATTAEPKPAVPNPERSDEVNLPDMPTGPSIAHRNSLDGSTETMPHLTAPIVEEADYSDSLNWVNPKQLDPESPVVKQNPSTRKQSLDLKRLTDKLVKQTSNSFSPDEPVKPTSLIGSPTDESLNESFESIPDLTQPTLFSEEAESTLFRGLVDSQSSISDSLPTESKLEVSKTKPVNVVNDAARADAIDQRSPVIFDPPEALDIEASIPSTEINQDPTDILPSKGFAVGGPVTASHITNHQPIAPSDTVSAMLTPGEFVINATDAQKNLNLLQHINSGTPIVEERLSTTQIPQSEELKPIASTDYTKVESLPGSLIQRKSSDISLPMALHPLIQASPALETEGQSLSTLKPLSSNPVDTRINPVSRGANYAPTPLIFRKQTPVTNVNNTPSQWSSVEHLLSGGSTESFDDAYLSFSSENSNRQNSEIFSAPEILRVSPNRLPFTKGFAVGGEVTAPEPPTAAQSVTETITGSPSAAESESPDLEVLAREIYGRLRQRLELERERHGLYSGRLPW